MSAFWAVCPNCGEHYFHLFVGTRLVSGHCCMNQDVVGKPDQRDIERDEELAREYGWK